MDTETTGPGANRTGKEVSRPTGECRSQGPPACHSKDNPGGVSRFASQTKPRELTNRRFQPRMTAIHHDQRTPTYSLPVLVRVGRVPAEIMGARYVTTGTA